MGFNILARHDDSLLYQMPCDFNMRHDSNCKGEMPQILHGNIGYFTKHWQLAREKLVDAAKMVIAQGAKSDDPANLHEMRILKLLKPRQRCVNHMWLGYSQSGPEGCQEQVRNEPRCVDDTLLWAFGSDKRCGCSTSDDCVIDAVSDK